MGLLCGLVFVLSKAQGVPEVQGSGGQWPGAAWPCVCGQLERGQPGCEHCCGHGSVLGAPGQHPVRVGTRGVLPVTQPAGAALPETCSWAKLAQTPGEIVESPSSI